MAFERLKHTAVGFIPEVRRARKEVAQNDYDATRADVDTLRPTKELRTDVTEVLGERRGLFDDGYRRKADALIKKVETAKDRSDHIGTREAFVRHRKNVTELKIQRVQAKLNDGSDGFAARQRRMKLQNLEYGQKMRKSTIDKLEGRRQSKPEHMQKKIDEVVQKKIKSMMKLAERKILREQHGVGAHNRRKRAEVLVGMTPEQKQHIVREAILLVRKQNIARGVLDDVYDVDPKAKTRQVEGHYDRVIE